MEPFPNIENIGKKNNAPRKPKGKGTRGKKPQSGGRRATRRTRRNHRRRH